MFTRRLLNPGIRASVRFYQVPTTTRKVIPVYPPVQSKPSPNLVNKLSEKDLDDQLDPQKWRRNLIDSKNTGHLRAGDVVRIVYDSSKCNYDNFIGYVLSLDRKSLAQDASVLLRNHVSKTAVEVRVPIFSPLVERIDLLRRSDGKRGRNKQYYIRDTKLDVGDLEANMRKRK